MKTQKFNKSQILKKAWSLVRKGWTMADALRTAWAYARNVIADAGKKFQYKGSQERIFESPVSKFQGDKLAKLQESINRGL